MGISCLNSTESSSAGYDADSLFGPWLGSCSSDGFLWVSSVWPRFVCMVPVSGPHSGWPDSEEHSPEGVIFFLLTFLTLQFHVLTWIWSCNFFSCRLYWTKLFLARVLSLLSLRGISYGKGSSRSFLTSTRRMLFLHYFMVKTMLNFFIYFNNYENALCFI